MRDVTHDWNLWITIILIESSSQQDCPILLQHLHEMGILLRGVEYDSGTAPCGRKEFCKIQTNFLCSLSRPVVWVCLSHGLLLHALWTFQGKNRVAGNCLACCGYYWKEQKKRISCFSAWGRLLSNLLWKVLTKLKCAYIWPRIWEPSLALNLKLLHAARFTLQGKWLWGWGLLFNAERDRAQWNFQHLPLRPQGSKSCEEVCFCWEMGVMMLHSLLKKELLAPALGQDWEADENLESSGSPGSSPGVKNISRSTFSAVVREVSSLCIHIWSYGYMDAPGACKMCGLIFTSCLMLSSTTSIPLGKADLWFPSTPCRTGTHAPLGAFKVVQGVVWYLNIKIMSELIEKSGFWGDYVIPCISCGMVALSTINCLGLPASVNSLIRLGSCRALRI